MEKNLCPEHFCCSSTRSYLIRGSLSFRCKYYIGLEKYNLHLWFNYLSCICFFGRFLGWAYLLSNWEQTTFMNSYKRLFKDIFFLDVWFWTYTGPLSNANDYQISGRCFPINASCSYVYIVSLLLFSVVAWWSAIRFVLCHLTDFCYWVSVLCYIVSLSDMKSRSHVHIVGLFILMDLWCLI